MLEAFFDKLCHSLQYRWTVSQCGEQAVSLAGSSDILPFDLPHQIIAGADAERHDGDGGVLASTGSETRPIHDKEILDVVALLKLIQDRFFRVIAHAGDPDFVDAPAGLAVMKGK